MAALTVFAADSLTASRSLAARVRKHPAMTAWFILLMLSATWMGLRIAELVASQGLDPGGMAVQPHTLLLVYFMILMGKSVVDTNSRVTQNREMMLILGQPVDIYSALWGKFAYIVVGNLAVLSVALGTAAAVHAAFTPGLLVPPWFVGCLVPLTMLSTAMGFVFSIITSQPGLARRLLLIAAFSQLASALYLSFEYLKDSPDYLVPASMLLFAAALCCVPLASRFFLAAWNYEVSGSEGIVQKATRTGSGRLFRHMTRQMDPGTRELLRKEMVINISRKEVGGTIFTIIGLAVVLVYLRSRIGGQTAISAPFLSIVLPLLVCVGLYIAAVLQYAMLGLSSLGKEGKNFWILKHLPVKSERIFQAKAGALLVFTPVIVIAIALPLPILAGMGPDWVLFFVLAALALAFAFTGVGIWSGTVYPNFDEGTRGTPDVMTMYLIMMVCLFFGGLIVGMPGLVMHYDRVVGVLCMALSADWCALFLYHAIKRSARNYDALEVGV
jgi:hypothetical protein